MRTPNRAPTSLTWWLLPALLSLANPVPGLAQAEQATDANALQLGEQVRITTDINGRFQARLINIRSDSLFIDVPRPLQINMPHDSGIAVLSGELPLPFDSVQAFEVRRCCASTGAGALKGGLLGIGAGVLVGGIGLGVGCGTNHLDCETDFAGRAIEFLAVRAAVGGAIGAVIGALVPPDRWVPLPIGRVHVGALPTGSGGVAWIRVQP